MFRVMPSRLVFGWSSALVLCAACGGKSNAESESSTSSRAGAATTASTGGRGSTAVGGGGAVAAGGTGGILGSGGGAGDTCQRVYSCAEYCDGPIVTLGCEPCRPGLIDVAAVCITEDPPRPEGGSGGTGGGDARAGNGALAGSAGRTGPDGTAGAGGCGQYTGAPIHCWKFDESGEETAIDSVGHSNGSFANTATRSEGYLGSGAVALPLLGNEAPPACVEFDASVARFGTEPFTVSHWLKTDYQGAGLSDVLGNRQDGSHGNFIAVRLRGDGSISVELDEDGDGTNYVVVETTSLMINDGAWHHFAYARQGATLSLYLDGALVDSARTASGATTNILGTNPFRVGRSLGNCCPTYLAMPLELDELRIYAAALSPCEILELYKKDVAH